MSFQPYGFMIAVALLVVGFLGMRLSRRSSISEPDFLLLMTYTCSFGVLSAKLLFLLINIPCIDWSRWNDADYLLSLLKGGFVFYGSIPGGLLGIALAHRLHRIPVEKTLRIGIPLLPLGHAIGRVGCALAGCCHGIPYSGLFAITYHHSIVAPNGISLFPVQPLEALLLFLLSLFLLHCRQKDASAVTLGGLYLLIYSYLRFWLEYLRGDEERGFLLCFSTSQWISLCIALLISVIFILRPFISRHHGQTSTPSE